MGNEEVQSTDVPTAHEVGDAVGVQSRKWLVARVSHNTEKSSRDKLLKMGIEAFAATQRETHNWKGRHHEVEVVRISTYLFVHVNREERDRIINFPFIKSFMIDRTTTTTAGGMRSAVIIPDAEIQRMKYMLYHADSPVSFVEGTFSKGDYVRVCRGELQGIVGQLVKVGPGAKHFGVMINGLGCAVVQLAPSELEAITEQEYNDLSNSPL